MKVEIWTENNSQAITIEAEASYQKGDLFCVKKAGEDVVYQYPIVHLFCVKLSEFAHSHKE